ncbi:uncharacterized protein LOC143886810 [Tasmannia lanceolata]|uniref:uncharacterized protein LOC143886810 n=1 Tax=Tasmannia lanceolata TaxID=3420 RepID=UPI0040635FD0
MLEDRKRRYRSKSLRPLRGGCTKRRVSQMLDDRKTSPRSKLLLPIFATPPRKGMKNEEVETPVNASLKKTVTWTVTMDRYLTEVLVEQALLGRKDENGFKKDAWAVAEAKLNARFGTHITKENCKNRLRTWKKHYFTLKSLLDQSGFRLDDVSSMVIADDSEWDEYLKTHPDAKILRNKPLPNYYELSIIVGKDQVDGSQSMKGIEAKIENNTLALDNAQTIALHMDVDSDDMIDDMHESASSDGGLEGSSPRSEHPSMASSGSKQSKKRKQITTINVALAEMTKAIRSLTDGTRETAKRLEKEKKIKTVYEEIRKIPDIDNRLLFKAIDYLTSDENNASIFLMLDENLRHEWLLFHLST